MAKQRVRVDLHYDGAWQEQLKPNGSGESAALVRDEIEVTDGRGGEQSEPTPSTCSLTLDNLTGVYNPRNPSSPLFGKIGRNTPIRVSVLGDSYMHTTADSQYASTPDHSSLDITGDIDIRVECQLDDYTDAALASKFGASAQRSWAFYIGPARQLLFWWSADGTNQTGFVASPALSVVDGERIALRVTLDVDDGAGQRVVRFFTAPTIAGPWTQHGSNTAAGATSIFASTAALEVGALSQFGPVWSRGLFFAAEVYAGAVLRANPKFHDMLDVDAFTDALGRTWTAHGDVFAPDSVRFVGEVSSWKPRRSVDFDAATGRGDAWTLVEAAGVLRRLTQGEEPSLSPWRRTITSAETIGDLLAYWPCEDSADSTAVASALSSTDPMVVSGTVDFAASEDKATSASTLGAGFGGSVKVGTDPLPNLAGGGRFVGAVPPGTSSPVEWTVAWTSRTNALQAHVDIVIARWFTPGGKYVRWDLLQRSDGLGYELFGYTTVGGGGQALLASTVEDQILLTEYRVTALQNGGTNAQIELWVAGNREDLNNFTNTNLTGLTSIEMNPDGAAVTGVTGFWVGHVQAWNVASAPSLGYSSVGQPTQLLDADGVKIYPWLGWLNERATDRLSRLHREQGVPFRLVGARTDGVRMGPQPTTTWTGLLAEVERTDVGILSDDRYAIGMVYRTRSNVYEQRKAVLALDYAAEEIVPPLDPDIDDLGVRNDVLAKRSNGSSARSTLEVGPLSVQPPPAGVGRVSKPVDVNPAVDATLPSLAAWWRMKGTLPGTRYSQVTVDLTQPIAATLAAPRVVAGDILTIANIPDDEDASLHTLGRVETIGSHTRKLTFNAGLAFSPLVVDGFGRTAAAEWGTTETGQPWLVSGGAAADYSVSSGTGRMSLGSVNVARSARLDVAYPDADFTLAVTCPVTPAGGAITLTARLRRADASNFVDSRLFLMTSGVVTIAVRQMVAGQERFVGFPAVPGVVATTPLRWRIQAVGSTLRAKAWAATAAEPATWNATMTASWLTPGGVELIAQLGTGNTNPLPVIMQWDDARVVHPPVEGV